MLSLNLLLQIQQRNKQKYKKKGILLIKNSLQALNVKVKARCMVDINDLMVNWWWCFSLYICLRCSRRAHVKQNNNNINIRIKKNQNKNMKRLGEETFVPFHVYRIFIVCYSVKSVLSAVSTTDWLMNRIDRRWQIMVNFFLFFFLFSLFALC